MKNHDIHKKLLFLIVNLITIDRWFSDRMIFKSYRLEEWAIY